LLEDIIHEKKKKVKAEEAKKRKRAKKAKKEAKKKQDVSSSSSDVEAFSSDNEVSKIRGVEDTLDQLLMGGTENLMAVKWGERVFGPQVCYLSMYCLFQEVA
jgi:hypothetical protein